MKINSKYKKVLKFLSPYFSGNDFPVAVALESYFEQYDLVHWIAVTEDIKSFLDEDYSFQDKESVISQYVDIDFDTKSHAPFLWLTSVLATIENRVIRVRTKEAAQEEFRSQYAQLFEFLKRFKCSRSFTPEDVLNQFFEETNSSHWGEIAVLIRQFLSEDLSRTKKVNYINEFVDIDFQYRNMPPLLWLKGVASSMDFRIEWFEVIVGDNYNE